jgi:hypothetical protein
MVISWGRRCFLPLSGTQTSPVSSEHVSPMLEMPVLDRRGSSGEFEFVDRAESSSEGGIARAGMKMRGIRGNRSGFKRVGQLVFGARASAY